MVHDGGLRNLSPGRGVLVYRSSDLRHWDYQHFIARGAGVGKGEPNPVASGDMWGLSQICSRWTEGMS